MNIALLIETFTAEGKASSDTTAALLAKMDECIQQAEERNKIAEEKHQAAKSSEAQRRPEHGGVQVCGGILR